MLWTDEKKPECERCLRAGYKCAGYTRDLVFHIATTASTATAASFSTRKQQRTLATPSVPGQMTLKAFAPTIQHTYLFTNFVWSTYGSPWLQASTNGALGPLAQKTTLAFAQTTFARHHHCNGIALTGTQMYGEVVAAVAQGLGSKQQAGLGQLLAPVVILLMYAASLPAQDGTANHVMGLFALLKMAGPKPFRRRPLRDAFSSCRATLLLCGLLQKKRLFLEDEEWRHEPWERELEPESKGEQDRLVDVLVFVPGYLEDQTRQLENPDFEGKMDLVDRVIQSLTELLEWRWRWEARNPHAVWQQSRAPPKAGTLPPPQAARHLLVFTSFTAAVEIALYNAVLLCLLGLLFSDLPPQQAQTHIAFAISVSNPAYPSQTNSGLNLPGTPLFLREAAIEIVQAFEYQLGHASSTPESELFWLFPFGLAAKVLQDDPETWTWIQQMLDESEVTRGYWSGDNAFGFGMYNLPKVDERVAELPDEMIVLRPDKGL